MSQNVYISESKKSSSTPKNNEQTMSQDYSITKF